MSRMIRRHSLIIIHIVLTLLALSACASNTPATNETRAGSSPSPSAGTDCETLRSALAQELGSAIDQATAPFSDPISGNNGNACQLTAKGTGKEFGSVVDVSNKIRALLTKQGWTEDNTYLADGPTGTAAGFRKGAALAVMNVEWQPAPEVQCPADQPIMACEVTPEQQIYTIVLNLVQ